MKVTADHLRDVLEDAISTYADDDIQINHDEISNIITQFKFGASQSKRSTSCTVE